MSAENDAAFRLLDQKWQVELDGTDISHTVEHISLHHGADDTAQLGITVPTGITQTSIDPVHHRMLCFLEAGWHKAHIVVKFGAALSFTGQEAQSSHIRIGQRYTAFWLTLRQCPEQPDDGNANRMP